MTSPNPDVIPTPDPDSAIAEACAWLRSVNRDRNGEDVAADLEAAFPNAAAKLVADHPGYASSIPSLASLAKPVA